MVTTVLRSGQSLRPGPRSVVRSPTRPEALPSASRMTIGPPVDAGAHDSCRARALGFAAVTARFGVSVLALAGLLAWAALADGGRDADALDLPRWVVVVLLVISVRNTWDLLVTVAASTPDIGG